MKVFLLQFTKTIKDGAESAFLMVKILLPVLLVVEALKFLDWMTPLQGLFAPLMHGLGLPVEFSLVWLVGILTGVYGGVAVFFAVVTDFSSVSVADATVLSGLLLLAHALPVELRVSSFLGVRVVYSFVFRFVLSLVFGFLLNFLFETTHWLQAPIWVVNVLPYHVASSWPEVLELVFWLCAQLFVLVLLVHMVMFILRVLGVVRFLEYLFLPIAFLTGIDKRLSGGCLVGILLGFSYGGSLLKRDFDTQPVDDVQKRKAVYFLSIFHSVLEDSAIVLLMGADAFFVVVGRMVFAVVVMWLFALQKKLWKALIREVPK